MSLVKPVFTITRFPRPALKKAKLAHTPSEKVGPKLDVTPTHSERDELIQHLGDLN